MKLAGFIDCLIGMQKQLKLSNRIHRISTKVHTHTQLEWSPQEFSHLIMMPFLLAAIADVSKLFFVFG